MYRCTCTDSFATREHSRPPWLAIHKTSGSQSMIYVNNMHKYWNVWEYRSNYDKVTCTQKAVGFGVCVSVLALQSPFCVLGLTAASFCPGFRTHKMVMRTAMTCRDPANAGVACSTLLFYSHIVSIWRHFEFDIPDRLNFTVWLSTSEDKVRRGHTLLPHYRFSYRFSYHKVGRHTPVNSFPR